MPVFSVAMSKPHTLPFSPGFETAGWAVVLRMGVNRCSAGSSHQRGLLAVVRTSPLCCLKVHTPTHSTCKRPIAVAIRECVFLKIAQVQTRRWTRNRE